MSKTHTVVIGAGIIGISTAYHLARRGHRVTVLERGAIDDGASVGNAGIIALGHPPLPRPGLVGRTMRWMLDRGSPLYVPPRLDWSLLRWLWQFRKACTEERFQHAAHVLADLGKEAGACFEQIQSDEGFACEYHRTGWYDVYRTEAGMAAGVADAELLERHGYEVQTIDGDELRARDKAFQDQVIGATHYVESLFLNPKMYLLGLAARAARHGASIRPNCEAVRIIMDQGRFTGVRILAGEVVEADALVLAAGSWTPQIAETIGVRIPMQPGKGYHVMLTRPTPCLSHACVLAERFIAVTPLEEGLRLAGTVELSGLNHHLVAKRLDMLRRGALQYLRGIGPTQVVSQWCGLRPCTADGLPIIGAAPGLEGVFIATGHGRGGFTLGPVTGRIISECILDGGTAFDLAPLRADRFEKAAEPAEPRVSR